MRRVIVLLALVLAGCGQAERAYTPAQPAASVDPSARAGSPSASPGDPTGTGAPSGPSTVELGEDFRVSIDWPEQPDPRLSLATDNFVDVRRAVATDNADRGYLDDLELPVAKFFTEWVRSMTDVDSVFQGEARLYDLRVGGSLEKGAQLEMCVDERRARLVSARTGRSVRWPSGWDKGPYRQYVVVHRGDDGTWKIRSLSYDPKGCPR
ncbi:hypothetical protein GBF35_06240 [Nonomuraea phyllanthi]|uniref:hypothetical protein n=1 Tax=Nonomuraea phyllanthi TaxID=2219224 RepID=UPI00129397CC|nr:hypothetical protein [Nonomuraea phyllanthi]QFY06329.1 hypothetical protein GBF35_06240 [Nonomuraea phyllanthi]